MLILVGSLSDQNYILNLELYTVFFYPGMMKPYLLPRVTSIYVFDPTQHTISSVRVWCSLWLVG